MGLISLTIIIVAILNFFVALVIILKNYKHPINWSYGLVLISIVFWSISLAMARETAGAKAAIGWTISSFCFGTLMVYFYLYFSYFFPYQSKRFYLWQKIAFFVPTLFLIIMYNTCFVSYVKKQDWGYDVICAKWLLIAFAFYFFSYLVYALANLIKKYVKSEGYIKIQLKMVIWGSILTIACALVVEVIFPIFDYWRYDWLGPYFTLFVLFFVGYLLFFNKD